MVLAYHHNKRLARVNVNLERLIRIRAESTVSDPVVADVAWIKATQISCSEDEVGAGARCVGIHRHTLSRASGIGEGVRIVMARYWVAENRTRRTRRTRLRNTAAEEPVKLRGIVSVDASADLATARCTRCRRCWCR